MDCEVLRTLYVKANGQIRCNDDVGERVVLGAVDDGNSDWSIADVLANEPYAKIRKALADDRPPWDGVCEQCPFLARGSAPRDLLVERRISMLHLEPTLACNLRCPCCSNQAQLRERPQPHTMPVGMWDQLLRSLRDGNYELDVIRYEGQGEPLMHPQFSEFVQLARKHFPATRQRLTTNGNFDYASKLAGAPLDDVLVSCDGVWQASYEQYRVGGEVERVIQFMRDGRKLTPERRPTIRWKYILFEFNDSTEELVEAQRVARDIGAAQLLFIVTGTKYRSQKYAHENLDTLPIESDLVAVHLHPVVDLVARHGEDQRPPWLDAMWRKRGWPRAPRLDTTGHEPELKPRLARANDRTSPRARGHNATLLKRLCGKKLAKLIRDPVAFCRDSRHSLVRSLGPVLLRRVGLWRTSESANRSRRR